MINRISVIRFSEINRIPVCHSAILPSPRKWNHIWRFFLKKYARKSLNISTVLFITSPWLALWVNPAPARAACVMPFFSPVSAPRIPERLHPPGSSSYPAARWTQNDAGRSARHWWNTAAWSGIPSALSSVTAGTGSDYLDPAEWWTCVCCRYCHASVLLNEGADPSRFLFVLSHADRMFPAEEWNATEKCPSRHQELSLATVIAWWPPCSLHHFRYSL